jgi:hypothetical protein
MSLREFRPTFSVAERGDDDGHWPDPVGRAGVNHQQLIEYQRTSGGRARGFSLSKIHDHRGTPEM